MVEKLGPTVLRAARLFLAAASVAMAGCQGSAAPAVAPPLSEVRLIDSRADLFRGTIGRESRFVVFGNQRLPISVPPGAKLGLGFGVAASTWEEGREYVDFTVSLQADGETRRLLERRVKPPSEAAPDDWQDAVLDLGPLAGRRGTLILEATASPALSEYEIRWTDPRLITPGAPAGTNVILISIDTLRSDHLGCYGYWRPTSPNVDRMAREGIVFRDFVASSSWTKPAHASMFTGLDPSRHGAILFALFQPLSRDLDTLAEHLWDIGYDTAGFTGGGFVAALLGFDQGFDRYRDNADSQGESDTLQWSIDMAKPWMEQRRGRRFFLFLHTYQVHLPYAPPPPYDTFFDPGYHGPYQKKFTRRNAMGMQMRHKFPPRRLQHLQALYDGEIRAMDGALGDLLDFLRASGLARNTCVLFTSDHGEEFGEHGGILHDHAKVYEELIRVPLVVWCPSRFRGGRIASGPVSQTDIMPTVLDIAGAPVPAGLDGRSLFPLLQGKPLEARKTTVSEVDGSIVHKQGSVRAVRGTRYKLIDSSIDGSAKLFDLLADPAEKRDLHATRPDLVRELRAAADHGVREPTPTPVPAMTPDDALRERLRALGYSE
jgi:arylsulfatase A-like enzyme